jgi:hypothetical protein
MGKIIFYYIVELVSKGIRYISGKPKYKDELKQIFDSLASNKSFATDMSKFIDMKRGLDRGAADSIIKMPFVQTNIQKVIKNSDNEIDETELENEFKNILMKSWSDLSVNAVEKVKKDIK